MDSKKQAILDALTAFMNQRASMDPHNYGDYKAYRAESRSVTRDLHDARTLLRAVMWRDSITADDLLAAFRAFSGRLTCKDISAHYDDGSVYYKFSLDYCTGQYFPTEYRKAVCAVLASALWDRKRADMPSVAWKRVTWTDGTVSQYMGPHEVEAYIAQRDGKGERGTVARIEDAYGQSKQSAGDWIRGSFKREFGPRLASRYFD